jgi:serine/threonine-protein kinase
LVFQVRDLNNDRQLALKVLQPEFPRTDAEMQQFAQAVKTILPLRHPNLVTVFGAGKTGPYCWLALEYVDGENLAGIIERTATAGRLDWRQCFRTAIQLGRALQFAHQNQLYHRNITPQNILVRTNDHVVKLNDLILATALKGSQIKQVALRGKTLRELVYLPPEQTYQNAQVDGRSDIYSVGTVLYALLAGRPPFLGESLPDTIRKIREEEPAAPEGLPTTLRGLFEEPVRRMLAKNPGHRFQNADELVTELSRVAWEQGLKV